MKFIKYKFLIYNKTYIFYLIHLKYINIIYKKLFKIYNNQTLKTTNYLFQTFIYSIYLKK